MAKKKFSKVKKILKIILPSFVFSYPSFRLYNFFQKSTGYLLERWLSSRSIGYWPNIKNPQSYNEKIIWKKIYDRNPLLTIVADKYKVRDYVKSVLGEEVAEKILVPLYFVTDNPKEIPFDNLPEEYIVKVNNGAGKFIIAEKTDTGTRFRFNDGKSNFILFDSNKTRKMIIHLCKKWLLETYGFSSLEWAYQQIKRKIIIEKLLKNNIEEIPEDYKFNIFNGKCHLIQVNYDRFTNIKRSWYTPDWEYIPVHHSAEYRNKPDNLREMLTIAEKLGANFDFIRVDLYSVDNNTYFGELTNYPLGGRTPFYPISWDFEWGSKWKLSLKYWKK